jgi:hypothetical protein
MLSESTQQWREACMTSKIVSTLLIIVGLINFIPVIGVVSGAGLESMYGVALQDGNLIILMRHRALLFGLLGALIVAAAFRTELWPAAYLAGFVSMLGFIALAYAQGDFGPFIRKIVIADIVASVLLAVAAILPLPNGSIKR